MAARWLRADVVGSSMIPTLAPGERLVVRAGVPPRRGDVVVVRLGGRLTLKRITAGPGDMAGGRVLGPDEWWVEGDNAAASTDSRTHGPVAGRDVLGRVLYRYRPWRARGRVS